ncbi:hypothetical protein LBMAG42_13960 [Deltaproteobacteria bacterium]|nr:hypothetical protein LBMAG42_13960 [Deltaproteobacteria bacterium]
MLVLMRDVVNGVGYRVCCAMSAPPTLLIVRHGQTAWNIQRKVLGRTDIPLDETGRAQAAALPAALGVVDAVWSSPLLRARETASATAFEYGLPVHLDDDLVEMHQGELDGLDETQLRERFGALLADWNAAPEGLRLPGGETMEEVQLRGLAALDRIAAASPPTARVVVVTHQLVLAAVLCALRNEPLRSWRSHTHRNTAWTEVRWAKPASVLAEKVSAHLPPP